VNLLSQRRRDRGMTQQQLAALVPGMTVARISELERRPLPARVLRLRAIAHALRLRVDDLIGGDGLN